MRLNKFIAQATGMSRRAADTAIGQGRVAVNHTPATTGQTVSGEDVVTLDGKRLQSQEFVTIMLNKPAGYVCSRNGQGSKTIYELLPKELHTLKPVGRLDKESSGLLLLTNNGSFANELTHPSHQKEKVYEMKLNKPLLAGDRRAIEQGVALEDGPSRLQLQPLPGNGPAGQHWRVTMKEGRNRQIRRTFSHLYYSVQTLHRTNFGEYSLEGLKEGAFIGISPILP
jgi:23S rRNA pseudouridine2605 synthase